MGLNGRVRDGNGCDPHAIATNYIRLLIAATFALAGKSSRAAIDLGQREESAQGFVFLEPHRSVGCNILRVSQATRAISTARLHVSPRFHLPPINVLVSHGPSEGPSRPWEYSS